MGSGNLLKFMIVLLPLSCLGQPDSLKKNFKYASFGLMVQAGAHRTIPITKLRHSTGVGSYFATGIFFEYRFNRPLSALVQTSVATFGETNFNINQTSVFYQTNTVAKHETYSISLGCKYQISKKNKNIINVAALLNGATTKIHAEARYFANKSEVFGWGNGRYDESKLLYFSYVISHDFYIGKRLIIEPGLLANYMTVPFVKPLIPDHLDTHSNDKIGFLTNSYSLSMNIHFKL